MESHILEVGAIKMVPVNPDFSLTDPLEKITLTFHCASMVAQLILPIIDPIKLTRTLKNLPSAGSTFLQPKVTLPLSLLLANFELQENRWLNAGGSSLFEVDWPKKYPNPETKVASLHLKLVLGRWISFWVSAIFRSFAVSSREGKRWAKMNLFTKGVQFLHRGTAEGFLQRKKVYTPENWHGYPKWWLGKG